jgi:hypothetical protein
MMKHRLLSPQSLQLRLFPYHHLKRRKIKTVPNLSSDSFVSSEDYKNTVSCNYCRRFFSSPTSSTASTFPHGIDAKTDENRNTTATNTISLERSTEHTSKMLTTTVESSNSSNVDVVSINHQSADEEESYNHDDILHEGKREKRSFRKILQLAWTDYKSTWEGFFDNLKVDKKKDTNAQEEEHTKEEDLIDLETIQQKQKELRANVNRNLKMIKEEGGTIVEVIKETTGMRNKRDVKMWAMEQLKLANECVAEFMKGYRAGRDEEMDKMMNEYFKDIDLDFQQQEQGEGGDKRDKKSTTIDNNSNNNTTEIKDATTTNQSKAGRIRRGWIGKKTQYEL